MNKTLSNYHIFKALYLRYFGCILRPHYWLTHLSSDNCTIGEYNIPRDTIVLINAWAFNRYPQLWSDPLSFKPERFQKEEVVNKLMQFGLGRRAYPGLGLAQRTVSWALGLLIQCFDWKRVTEEEIDMTKGAGLTMSKVVPLEAICKA